MFFEDWWQTYLDFRSGQPRIFIHFSLVLFFLGLTTTLAISIIVAKVLKQLRNSRFGHLNSKYDTLISEIILSPEASETRVFSERHIFMMEAYKKKYLRSNFARDIMIDRMLQLKRSIEGALEHRIIELYRGLNLHLYSIRKVKSMRWHIVVKGMKEVAEMQIKEANYLLIGHLSSRNDHVIREAQIALIKLNPQNPLYFLDQPGIFLSTWQELRIHRFIKKYSHADVLALEKWLGSSNSSVIKFALRLIALFQQLSAAEKVAGFLTHPDPQIRSLSARTLEELSAYHLSESLLIAMPGTNDEVAPIFLKALTELSAPAVSQKMAKQLLAGTNYKAKKEAVRTLLHTAVAPEAILLKVAENERPAVEKIIRHLQEPLLR